MHLSRPKLAWHSPRGRGWGQSNEKEQTSNESSSGEKHTRDRRETDNAVQDEDMDEYAPDDKAPQTTIEEDLKLLQQCEQATDEEHALYGKETTLKQWEDAGSKPAVQVYADASKEISLSI